MYNNLGEQRGLIEREIQMLSSVQEAFDTSASNQHTKVAECLSTCSRPSMWPIWRIS